MEQVTINDHTAVNTNKKQKYPCFQYTQPSMHKTILFSITCHANINTWNSLSRITKCISLLSYFEVKSGYVVIFQYVITKLAIRSFFHRCYRRENSLKLKITIDMKNFPPLMKKLQSLKHLSSDRNIQKSLTRMRSLDNCMVSDDLKTMLTLVLPSLVRYEAVKTKAY